MSQNWQTLNNGREILYGFDAPTGGFFLSEFYSDTELDELVNEDETIFSVDGITLSDLKLFSDKYGFDLDIRLMLTQVKNSNPPTNLQLQVGKMFGVDVEHRLKLVYEDLMRNWVDALLAFGWS